MAVAERATLRIVPALRPHDLIDLGLHDPVQHAEPNRRATQLAEQAERRHEAITT